MKRTSISNSKIKARAARKRNPEILEAIQAARKAPAWKNIANFISGPRNNYSSVNLKTIEEQTKTGDTVLVPGKVLSSGDISKKVRIVAISISDSALSKLKKTKSEFATIQEEIKINPKASGIKIIK